MRELAQVVRGRVAIKANGGIAIGEDVLRVLAADASSVDILARYRPHLHA